jgi:heme exporter protein C
MSTFKRWLPLWLLGAGGLLTTAAWAMVWLVAPFSTYPDGRIDFAQKIFYFHVPVAISSFLVFFFTAFYGVLFLVKKDRIYDTKARIATEVTLLLVVLTMATGDLWTRAEWGVWWVWEPRLTTYFIMMLLVIAYFVLRNSIEDPERRATYAAVFGIIAFIDAPISFLITRWYRSIHPIVFGGGAGTGLEPPMLITFLIAMAGMLMVSYAIFQLRMRQEELSERLEAMKIALGG